MEYNYVKFFPLTIGYISKMQPFKALKFKADAKPSHVGCKTKTLKYKPKYEIKALSTKN